ncbi:MAG: 3'-5' exonuclease [Spirochaetia bacterium]|jgi:DNA polymerase-3 subunit epsilon|nr:3'-5' exonuclease [Spirochaetia bacterium]
MNYTALDFETANAKPGGACSLGLAKFNGDGKLIGTWYSLIRPVIPYFNPYMSAIHGLDSSKCLCSPEFDRLWPEILDFIQDDVLVAHNAQFDMRVLKGCLDCYGLGLPVNPYACTLQISRKVWPCLENHKLTTLSQHFGFDYKAHYALDDAINCGLLLAKAGNGHLGNLHSFECFLEQIHLNIRFLQ